jgi:aminopeptidase N
MGKNNPGLAILAHQINLAQYPLALQVFNNPYNAEKYILYLHNSMPCLSNLEINNYAEYSSLGFDNCENVHKSITTTSNGIIIYQTEPVYAIPTKQAPTLADILPELATNQLIYIGEQHDKYAHHLNQLAIIKYLHAQGHELAIGMEMFQRKHQLILDQYTGGMLSERAFLRESEYFKTWFYDYNLYKPILDYAKEHNIPVIALNINDEVIMEMSETTNRGLHSLDDSWLSELPSNLDFTNFNYQSNLHNVFSYHEKADNSSFTSFVQVQTLWDETMAESIVSFLQANPESKLVVLAGNWHVRHYGIPQRVLARHPIDYINITQDDNLDDNLANYVLLTKEIPGQPPHRLGVGLKPLEQQVQVIKVEDDSVAQRIGIQVDDIILQFADNEIKNVVDLRYALFYAENGQSIVLQRGTENIQLSVTFD